jgi:hypothetical protein
MVRSLYLRIVLDIIIIEDDPYYFLQEGYYQPKEVRRRARVTTPKLKKGENEATRFISSLLPTYLKYGRPNVLLLHIIDLIYFL